MTVTIEASANRVAQLSDGRIVIAMPGVLDRSLYFGPDRVNPPADLVAVTEPCKTCKGRGKLQKRRPGGGNSAPWPCPDCHAGRPLFDLKVECDNPGCNQGHEMSPADDGSDIGRCRNYCVDGFVTHAGLYVHGPVWPCIEAPHRGVHTLPASAVPGWYAAIAKVAM